ncbi:MarR family winged helix-turn-helix transcriptional regulator [Actinomadura violacea]|uniref:MarR family transcriptional regulator n=1 Tax=Actinomadura violacea TaxID=2819934 RepID=A0ABS3S0Z5_9ACTN|nr:MarR family transcriptional regulator [Actinomadura violacea]MBO2462378.1 MarR family transcriptional regulator [Actinomadura violacea]
MNPDPTSPGPAGPGKTTADDASSGAPALATRAWTEMQAFVTSADRRRVLRAELELGPKRAGVLIKLTEGPLTLREIAETADVDPPAATIAVNQFQRRGLVRRDPHPDDNRRKLVHLTDAGLQAAETARRILTAPPPALAVLDADDLATLTRILTTLNSRPAPAVPD